MRLALAACLLAQLARASLLAVVDERSTTSTFHHLWRTLKERGHDVVVSSPQDASVKLRQEPDRFEHLVVFTPSAKQLPAELSPQALARRLDAGTNLVLVVPPDAPELWRDFAREFELELADRGQHVVDHFSFEPEGDDGSHTLLSVPLVDAPAPFVSHSTRSGSPVLYRGAGHAVGRHPLVNPILTAGATAFTADTDTAAPPEVLHSADSSVTLVSAFQAHNNARALFIGSFELFSDELLDRVGTGNLAFARDIFSWVCQKTGQLRVVDLNHREEGQDHRASSYRTGSHLEFNLSVSAIPAYGADDLQVEFGMIDPHLRVPLVRLSGSGGTSESSLSKYGATFVVPDRHGVFTLRIDHRRPGWTNLRVREVVSVTPPRHDEYERFIAGALPYYGGAASVSAAFIAFVVLWTLQS